MGLIMLVGGRTFFESIPQYPPMILIRPHCTLWVLFLLVEKYRYNHAVWHFCARGCCLSLRSYFIGSSFN
jgi:hemolysin III